MSKSEAVEHALEIAILNLLARRGRGKTICPSEAARVVASDSSGIEWEDLMEPARAAAHHLVAMGKIVVTQHGEIVELSTAKGPIRLRLR